MAGSNLSGEGKKDFIIARRELDEEDDRVTLIPVYLIVGAPEDTEVSEMKEILERAGEYAPAMWREFRVVPNDEWGRKDNWTAQIDDVQDWAISLRDEEHLLEHVHEPAPHGTTYDELVGRLNLEKRITLRLPWTLHVALSRAAGNMTLNSFCIKTLADAVGYKEEVKEFEAQRRKPGRPKKVQDGE